MSFRGKIRSFKFHKVLRRLSIQSIDGSSVRLSENCSISSTRLPESIKAARNHHSHRKDCALSPKQKNRAGSPSVRRAGPGRRRAFCLASFLNTLRQKLLFRRRLPGSMTVEAAFELPIFFLAMLIVLQYSAAFRTSAEFSCQMTETAEKMAILAYTNVYNDSNGVIRTALSDVAARADILSHVDYKGAVKDPHVIASSYLTDDERIKLILSYKVDPLFSVVPIPGETFVQKISIRGWTGREGSSFEGRSDDEAPQETEDTEKVYVTATGSVYHTDPNCTHLRLRTKRIPAEDLKTARNKSGAKYKKCRHCGGTIHPGDTVIISPYGDAYHTSASCPGLKRTVRAVSREEAANMHECKDCAKRRKAA